MLRGNAISTRQSTRPFLWTSLEEEQEAYLTIQTLERVFPPKFSLRPGTRTSTPGGTTASGLDQSTLAELGAWHPRTEALVYPSLPLIVHYWLEGKIYEQPSLPELRIDEQGIEHLMRQVGDRAVFANVGQALRIGIRSVAEQFGDLVAEVHVPEDFAQGQLTGQYQLVVVINQEEYSPIEVLLKLADVIFGPLFNKTGVLFGLTILSEREWAKLRTSQEVEVSNTLGQTVCVLRRK